MQAIDEYTYLGGGILRPLISLEEYLLQVLQQGSMTRDGLVKVTGIPRTTLYDQLIKLILKNKVEKYSKSNKKRGRPVTKFRLKKFYRK